MGRTEIEAISEKTAEAVVRRLLAEGLLDKEVKMFAAQGLREIAMQLELFCQKLEGRGV